MLMIINDSHAYEEHQTDVDLFLHQWFVILEK